MFSQSARPMTAEEEHSREASSNDSLDESATSNTRLPLLGLNFNRDENAGLKVDKWPSVLACKKAYKRFEAFEDGTHVHLLKSAKRRKKVADVLRNVFEIKKKDKRSNNNDLQLSHMFMWADLRRHKQKQLGPDKTGGKILTATLLEKYGKCDEVVGRGGFGVVSISHKQDPKHPNIEQLCAVKEFRRRPRQTPKGYQKRLTSEFCIASSLRHPNLIHTLDLLKDAKGDYCMVMEFCAGGDLQSLVHAKGKLEVAESDCYFNQLMRGVEYMHDIGVAHLDLKPENLLLTKQGALKITDFGSGECFRMPWKEEAHMTAGLRGSAPYIAPEEYVDAEFDPRAVDVWAAGIVYMAMRTGRWMWKVAKKCEDENFKCYLTGRRDEDGYGPIETLHRVSRST
jgi:protein-serine/threonine kinase